MKIFITGATGFIGTTLVKNISKKNKVKCLVRLTSDISNIKNFCEIVYGDLMIPKTIERAICGSDIVIHLATSHGKGNEKRNFFVTKNLIDLSEKNRIKKFIYVSSMAAKRRNLDSYGKTKLKIEEMIKKSSLNYFILRPSVIYSENNLSIIGQSLTIPFIIPIMGDGKYKIGPVCLGDVIKMLKEAINKKTKNCEYDLAGGRQYYFNDLLKIAAKRFGIRKIMIHIPLNLLILLSKIYPFLEKETLMGLNEDSHADITLLTKSFKVVPISFEEGIKNVNLR